jgi:hypothetical protein
VLVGSRGSGIAVAPVARAAVVSVCAGLAGFVVVATAGGTSSVGAIRPGPAQAVAAGAFVLAAASLSARGRARCLLLAASAAMLFGTGSALIRAGSQLIVQASSIPGGLGLAAEAVALLVIGGWWLHQAYAFGPAAVVIAATTVIDPLSAVAVGIVFYGEAAGTSLGQALEQGAFALLAVAGVIVLARSIPDPRPIDEEHNMPSPGPSHGSGLRIVIGADTFPPDINGAANFADRLARGLARRGHRSNSGSPGAALPVHRQALLPPPPLHGDLPRGRYSGCADPVRATASRAGRSTPDPCGARRRRRAAP